MAHNAKVRITPALVSAAKDLRRASVPIAAISFCGETWRDATEQDWYMLGQHGLLRHQQNGTKFMGRI